MNTQTVDLLLNRGVVAAIDLPGGELLLASEPIVAGQLPAVAAAWVARPASGGISARLGGLAQMIADVVDPRR